jgi:predicted Zn-dependent protease
MLPGDIVTRVDGRTSPKQSWKSWLDNEAKNVGETRPMKVEVRRGGESKTLAITPIFSCNIPVELVPDTDTNAYTDAKKIVIFTGVMRVAATDPELAVVVGHELAHVTMGHRAKKQQNMVAGAALGLAADVAVAMMGVNTGGAGMDEGAKAGLTAYALDFEREADYVGAYYAARAGFPLASEPFWRTMAQENPKSITFAGLHPTAPERFLLMQKTQAEIAEKMRLKQPLVPERKVAFSTQGHAPD